MAATFRRYPRRCFGSLAQVVEHRTFNPMVTGSNPVRPTNRLPSGGRLFLLEVSLHPVGGHRPTHEIIFLDRLSAMGRISFALTAQAHTALT